ncbi:chemotaxis protein CheW [Massilia pseudoviolaceinigra]|uniref:chemotaxis protein CheW n=1 Tax=Massilia pseudoviolaceinigra TaxID=3057165 RepID=UPI0027968DE7|nr:chemotaxis protein CheW [Massilia sp. CCM 9206]MDQ1922941.1 chemotaxis protein CheW [Massilia sp. CCM 9206]
MSTFIRSTGAARAPDYLAFTLGAEEYGIDIQKVQELRGYDAVTCIANAPMHIKGVINLRGIIVPIVDLRIKFGNALPSYDQFTVVIILNLGARVMGLVVDSVSDVSTLDPSQIKPAPAIGAGYMAGLGIVGARMLILIDVERLMGSNALHLPDAIAA